MEKKKAEQVLAKCIPERTILLVEIEEVGKRLKFFALFERAFKEKEVMHFFVAELGFNDRHLTTVLWDDIKSIKKVPLRQIKKFQAVCENIVGMKLKAKKYGSFNALSVKFVTFFNQLRGEWPPNIH